MSNLPKSLANKPLYSYPLWGADIINNTVFVAYMLIHLICGEEPGISLAFCMLLYWSLDGLVGFYQDPWIVGCEAKLWIQVCNSEVSMWAIELTQPVISKADFLFFLSPFSLLPSPHRAKLDLSERVPSLGSALLGQTPEVEIRKYILSHHFIYLPINCTRWKMSSVCFCCYF